MSITAPWTRSSCRRYPAISTIRLQPYRRYSAEGYVFFVVTWFYRGRLETADARIKFKDELLADYKAKLSGATPDEAKARLDALQAQLDLLKPRQLTPEQIEEIGLAVSRHPSSIYFMSDISSPDAIPYREQFVEPFEKANWKVSVGQIGAPPARAPSGLGVFVNDPVTAEQTAVLHAFRAASVECDKMSVAHRYSHVVVQINSRGASSPRVG